MHRNTDRNVIVRRVTARRLLLPVLILAGAACDRTPTDPFGQADADAMRFAKGGNGPKSATGATSPIVFSASVNGAVNIYRIGADGSNPVQLTSGTNSTQPAWSPKYDRIAFTSTREGYVNKIFTMNPDGTGVVRATNPVYPQADRYPTWSPDGKRIAFVRMSRKPSPNPVDDYINVADIFILTLQTGAIQRLTTLESSNIRSPHWSPDGKRILFTDMAQTSYYNYLQLFSIRTDGQDLQRLTWCEPGCRDGRYSPDGTSIVLHQAWNRIATVPATGGNPVPLFYDGNYVDSPSYSPDGTKIIFRRTLNSVVDMWTMNASGGNPTRLAVNPPNEMEIAWSR